MPNSLKSKIKHLCHNRTITESECDRILKALEQEPKTGHWIYDRTRNWDGECKYECSECGMGSDVDYAYCMRCGAKMVEPQESEVAESNNIYCTECHYFNKIIYDGEQWFGARCDKDGHSKMPSMYAIKSLHDDCPLVAEINPQESEDKE